MQAPGNIQFLQNNQIDKGRWDACIDSSPNGLIYAKTFYLDSTASGWSALASDDYSWVLPLTHRTKWGITYLYQPAFNQQLGVFAQAGVTVPYSDITRYLQQRFSFWEVNWNQQTKADFTNPHFRIQSCSNYVLHLHSPYREIAAGYHKDLTKNLKRSGQFGHSYQLTEDYSKCIQLYRDSYGSRMAHVTPGDYENFSRVCREAQKKGMLVCRIVADPQQQVLAAAVLLFDGRRLYNLANTTVAAGRKTEANHFLIDAVIQEFAGQEVVLDFEGSDLPGVKQFYEIFGAVNQPYFHIKYNALPWPLNLFKK